MRALGSLACPVLRAACLLVSITSRGKLLTNKGEGSWEWSWGLGDSRRRRADVCQRAVGHRRHLVALEDQVSAAFEDAARGWRCELAACKTLANRLVSSVRTRVSSSQTTQKLTHQQGGGGGSGRNPNRTSYASTTEHSASLQTPKSASSSPYFAKCCWYAPIERSFASLSK
jgi:hypothetical protein